MLGAGNRGVSLSDRLIAGSDCRQAMTESWLASETLPASTNMWPVFQRELLIRGRSWTTWGLRVFVTLAALALAAAVGLLYQLSRGLRIASGPMVFSALFYTLMLFCLIEGLRTTALGFPEERREGTLGLLFLTPLSSFDVLVGKLSGAALTAVYGLLSVVA